MKRLIFAGGGTGGHVLPGLAIAEAWLKKHGQSGEVLFIGSHLGLESKLVPQAGYRLICLPIGPLNRVSRITQIKTLLLLPFALLQALFLLIVYRPVAVLGVGGYASGPVVLVARILSPFLGIKTAIMEQNSRSGFTNRRLSRWVHRVYLAFQEAAFQFDPKKVLVTGNPIRSTIPDLPPACLDPFTLFIFGGSQGALGMNSVVIQALPFLKSQGIHFIHQTGEKDFDRVKAAYESQGIPARVEKFIHDMAGCYTQASLVICRAGSSTLSEIARVGRAAVFVPLPTSADNHQALNADIWVKRGAAVAIDQNKISGQEFSELVLGLKQNPDRIRHLELNAKQCHHSDTINRVVQDLSEGL